jgi:cold shock CspA family protein
MAAGIVRFNAAKGFGFIKADKDPQATEIRIVS